MAIELLVGLNVIDDEMYTAYRQQMKPYLEKNGGEIRCDFKISQVLKSETESIINRVFTIRFPDEKSKESFFTDDEYLKVREKYFKPSVDDTTIIRSYEI